MFSDMVKSVGSIILLGVALSFARADGKAQDLGDERERRWNTPPELTPESSVVRMSDNGEPRARLLSPAPVAATISLNAGRNNAHSVSLGASLDGISLSESNSYNHPAGYRTDGSSISVSKSTTVSAGLSGISSAGAEAYSDGNNAKTESHSLGFGQAAAASFGAVENGQAITGAASSVGISQSSAVTGDNRGQGFSQAGAAGARYPNRPTWSHVGLSDERNDRRSNRPTLTISKPYDGVPPVTLNIDEYDPTRREQRPRIHIYKWRPNHAVFPRPSLSIEHQEPRPHASWNRRSHGATGLQVGVSSGSSSSYEASPGDSAFQDNASPFSLASSSSGQVHTSRYAQSYAQSGTPFVHRSVAERTRSNASGRVSGDSFGEGHSESASTSWHRAESAVTRVGAQSAGNERARGIASSEVGSFVKFPEGGSAQSQTVPSQYVKGISGQSDSDVFSDVARAVSELLDVV